MFMATGTTGLSSASLPGGETVHSVFGLLDGCFTLPELQTRLESHPSLVFIRSNISSLHTIMIDKVSMLSAKTFEQCEMVCRVSKQNNLLWGGIQVIVVGDFRQLPPVPNFRYGDRGEFCFQTQLWENTSFHVHTLHTALRQRDSNFFKALVNMQRGTLEQNDHQYFQHKPNFETTSETVHLYSMNIDVEQHNLHMLEQAPGEAFVFRSKDTGNRTDLSHCSAIPALTLKLNCPVILMVNLGPGLVNGLRGTVEWVNMGIREVRVKFENGRVVNVGDYHFHTYNPSIKQNTATRQQIPLRLAYTLTVHRAQGLTLQRAVMHCTGMQRPGMLAVACSRVRGPGDLNTLVLSPNSTACHPALM